jgi:hypothetical protein
MVGGVSIFSLRCSGFLRDSAVKKPQNRYTAETRRTAELRRDRRTKTLSNGLLLPNLLTETRDNRRARLFCRKFPAEISRRLVVRDCGTHRFFNIVTQLLETQVF